MVEFLIDRLHDTRFLAMLFAAVAAIATVMTLAMPLLAGDNLNKRLKSVAIEREKIRARERERMARGEKVSLRQSPKQYMKTVVDQFNLGNGSGRRKRATSCSRPVIAATRLTSRTCSSAWSRRSSR